MSQMMQAEAQMRIVVLHGNEPRTSTAVVAAGVEVEHKAVIQLVRNYQGDLEEFGRVAFEMAPFETAGGTQRREVALLNEQQATLVMTYMKNTPVAREFKKKLVKAFYELARKASDPLAALNDPAAMRSLLLTYSEKVLMLQPKADAHDRLCGAEGMVCIRDAAKALKLAQSKLVAWLLANKWMYRDGKGKLRGYADKTPRYVIHKITPIPVDGEEDRVSLQAMITAEGLTRLAAKMNVELERAA